MFVAHNSHRYLFGKALRVESRYIIKSIALDDFNKKQMTAIRGKISSVGYDDSVLLETSRRDTSAIFSHTQARFHIT